MGWLKRLKNQADTLIMRGVKDGRDEKQIETIMDELKSEMSEAQVRITNHTATVNELREREENVLELANRRHDEARLAVLHGDDDAAKRALTEEQLFREQYQAAREVRKQAEDTLLMLRSRLQQLESHVHGLDYQKDEYLARLRTAELTKTTADIKGGIDERGRVFERIEQKVIHKELEAEAHAEIAGLSHSDREEPYGGSSVDDMLFKLQSALQEQPTEYRAPADNTQSLELRKPTKE